MILSWFASSIIFDILSVLIGMEGLLTAMADGADMAAAMADYGFDVSGDMIEAGMVFGGDITEGESNHDEIVSK